VKKWQREEEKQRRLRVEKRGEDKFYLLFYISIISYRIFIENYIPQLKLFDIREHKNIMIISNKKKKSIFLKCF